MNYLLLCILALFGKTIDAQGWTQIALSPDSLAIYVDEASGQDSNPGTESAPKKTIAVGFALLRDKKPDHLRLHSGGIWPEAFPNWTKSGRSATEPMVVETYGGSARAKIRAPAGAEPFHFNGGGGAPPRLDHLVVKGLDFEPSSRSPSDDTQGIVILRTANNILFEGCRVYGYKDNIVLMGYDGQLSNIRLRRCVVGGAFHDDNAHAQGLYAWNVVGLDVFECAFIHNGHSTATNFAGTIFNHNAYIDNGQPATFQACIFAEGGSHGMQLRGGGSVIACLFVRNPISLLIGGGSTPDPGGVLANARGNVILEGTNIDPQNKRGWALNLENIKSGKVVDIYVAHQAGGQPSGFSLGGSGVKDLTIARCTIHQDWGAGYSEDGDPATIGHVTQQNNHFLAPASSMVDPARGIPSYMASIGMTPTTDAYLKAVLEQGPDNWNKKLWPQGGVIRHVMLGLYQK